MKFSIDNYYIKNRFIIFHQHVFASRFEVCGLCFDRLDQKWYVSTDSNQAVYVSNIFDRGKTFRQSSTEKKNISTEDFVFDFMFRPTPLYVSLLCSTLCFDFVFDLMFRSEFDYGAFSTMNFRSNSDLCSTRLGET